LESFPFPWRHFDGFEYRKSLSHLLFLEAKAPASRPMTSMLEKIPGAVLLAGPKAGELER